MNPSNSTEADPGLLPTSSTHPGSRPDLSRPEPMSNDDISDSDVSFDDDDDDEDMHDTSGKIIHGLLNPILHGRYYFYPLVLFGSDFVG